MDQVVDTETAKEFMRETLEVVDVSELAQICVDVEEKSAWFQAALDRDALAELTKQDYFGLLQRVFSVRGKARSVMQGYDVDAVRSWITELLYGSGNPGKRFDAFACRLDGLSENLRVDVTGELLHFAQPDRHWLWTRWMWDPKTKTGALPLVTTAAYDFAGESPGAIYMKVGRAIAFVHEVGGAAGFQKISRSIFGTDVFLCSVYVVYAYTVLRMRMTQEFNKVMPGLPEFCRRLLGVHRKPSAAPAGTA